MIKYDNCKNCFSNCEHAGKDREFVCAGGISCKVERIEDNELVKIIKRYQDVKSRVPLSLLMKFPEEIKEAFEKTNELKPKVELLEAIANIMNI